MAEARRTAPGERLVVAQPDENLDELRADKLAATAWAQWAQANPEIANTIDYIAGFKKGFADYLQGRSDGEPPTVPPSTYGPGAYESVQGRKTVLEWFRGFRAGAREARASGLRADATAAISLPLSPPPRARHVHEITPAEILILPLVMSTAS
jgi:hypothetical protein